MIDRHDNDNPDLDGPAPTPSEMANSDSTMPVGASSGAITLTVPLSALAMPGEDEQMNNPAKGDPVHFHVEGKVSNIMGDTALVSVETVNGKPLTAKAAAVNDTPNEEAEYAQLRDMAAQQGGAV